MAEQLRGWSFSFAGCGFMGFYYLGVTRCLNEHAPQLVHNAPKMLGASAGALHCATVLCGLTLDHRLQILMDLCRSARKRNLGVLHPSFHMSQHLRDGLNKHLPDNAHQLVSGKMVVSLTRVSDGKNVLVSDFDSKEEVIDRYIDGGASSNSPLIDAGTTITVSPFYGEYDICPKVISTNFFYVAVTDFSFRFCSANVYLVTRALFPPEPKVLGEICLRGYLDAFRFLEEKGICNPSPACLNGPSEESEPEITSSCGENESPPTTLRRQRNHEMTAEGTEFLDHLRLSIIPWDEDILEILSPAFYLALQKSIKEKGGYLAKILNSLPVRIMSYMMLPCTLPVESVFFVVQRLVRWFPDMPKDLEWLQWMACKMCSQATEGLFSPSKNQRPCLGRSNRLVSPEAVLEEPGQRTKTLSPFTYLKVWLCHKPLYSDAMETKAGNESQAILKANLMVFSNDQIPG
ncbi:1-acylglycerol-3-phosphate O-acyltransferase PNPLA3 isoform X2 [Monodelphis domestica]|uniref:1-acylglycerol-3-phosphate O-acyltransferase PNPLA3 isoform X2 n=1 Tax=Monodelphis domestica TaxID=13616 RepID=UPI0024E1AD63|nr:1-acylglycerol-3-phosphate O-acyltransferase PNPLA3 isoform X2 [Monodelphis domestica]